MILFIIFVVSAIQMLFIYQDNFSNDAKHCYEVKTFYWSYMFFYDKLNKGFTGHLKIYKSRSLLPLTQCLDTNLSHKLHEFFVPVGCVLYDVLQNSKFPVWNDFQFCLTARQADSQKKRKKNLSPLCACVIGTNSEPKYC